MIKFKKFNLSKGFTLVELLVVIAIIGVLATLVLLQLGTARARARDAKRIADVSQLRTALELYFDNSGGRYPTAPLCPAPGVTCGSTNDLTSFFSSPNLPVDPLVQTAYPYAWNPSANPLQYHIWTELERINVQAFTGDTDIDSTGWASGTRINGATEACTSAANDCIYDLGQN